MPHSSRLVDLPNELLLIIINETILADANSAESLLGSCRLFEDIWEINPRRHMRCIMDRIIPREVQPAALLYLRSSKLRITHDINAEEREHPQRWEDEDEPAWSDSSVTSHIIFTGQAVSTQPALSNQIEAWYEEEDFNSLPRDFTFGDVHKLQVMYWSISRLSAMLLQDLLACEASPHDALLMPISASELNRAARSFFMREHFRSVDFVIETLGLDSNSLMRPELDDARIALPSGFTHYELCQLTIVNEWLQTTLHHALFHNIACYRERRCCHLSTDNPQLVDRRTHAVSKVCRAVQITAWETSSIRLDEVFMADEARFPLQMVNRDRLPVDSTSLHYRADPAVRAEDLILETAAFSLYPHWVKDMASVLLGDVEFIQAELAYGLVDESASESVDEDANNTTTLQVQNMSWPMDLVDCLWGLTTGEQLLQTLAYVEETRQKEELQFPVSLPDLAVAVSKKETISTNQLRNMLMVEGTYGSIHGLGGRRTHRYPRRIPEWRCGRYILNDGNQQRMLNYGMANPDQPRFLDTDNGPRDMYWFHIEIGAMDQDQRPDTKYCVEYWPLYDRLRLQNFTGCNIKKGFY